MQMEVIIQREQRNLTIIVLFFKSPLQEMLVVLMHDEKHVYLLTYCGLFCITELEKTRCSTLLRVP